MFVGLVLYNCCILFVYFEYDLHIVHGNYENINIMYLLAHVGVATRGNKYELYQSYDKYDLRKHFFSNRVVSFWNSLPGGVVDCDTTNCYKSRLDTFWTNHDVVYNWGADFTGTENRIYVCYNVFC